VQPETFLRWHRQGFCLFRRWESAPGRPPLARRPASAHPPHGAGEPIVG
jgi:hypothetical protein